VAGARDVDEPRSRNPLDELSREPGRQHEVELTDRYERRRRDRADPVGRVVLEKRRRRAAEGVHRLRVRARLGGREPLVHDALVPDPGREAPQVDRDEEIADRVRLPRGPHPASEDLVQEAVAPAPGPVEDETPDALGMGERKLLRDRATHRRADDVSAFERERIQEGGGVGGEVGDPEATFGRRRATDTAVVEDRDPVAVAQTRDLIDPARALVGEPGDEEDVVARALLLDPELDPVRAHGRHGAGV
jgi:hypothetical protein